MPRMSKKKPDKKKSSRKKSASRKKATGKKKLIQRRKATHSQRPGGSSSAQIHKAGGLPKLEVSYSCWSRNSLGRRVSNCSLARIW